MEELIRLRRELHRNPELSGQEHATAKRLRFFLSRYKPDALHISVGGNGMIALYGGKSEGPTVLCRCELDAIPIHESSRQDYRSVVQSVSHTCGHDGHMAIVCGLTQKFHLHPPKRGRLALLFQPAEETGEGAKRVVEFLNEHPNIAPQYSIALHNMPKYPKGQVLLARHTFAAASKGIIINLTGRNSHAAYPERGINPAAAVSEIMQYLLNIKEATEFKDFVLITIVHVMVGDVAFGTSAGSATIMATMRAFDNEDMAVLTEKTVGFATQTAQRYGLGNEIQFTDEFPATICDPHLTSLLESTCTQNNIPFAYLEQPNRWSEDFAHFASISKSLIFGLGAGVDQPEIHTAEYDFPDSLIEDGINIMEALVLRLLD